MLREEVDEELDDLVIKPGILKGLSQTIDEWSDDFLLVMMTFMNALVPFSQIEPLKFERMLIHTSLQNLQVRR